MFKICKYWRNVWECRGKWICDEPNMYSCVRLYERKTNVKLFKRGYDISIIVLSSGRLYFNKASAMEARAYRDKCIDFDQIFHDRPRMHELTGSRK